MGQLHAAQRILPDPRLRQGEGERPVSRPGHTSQIAAAGFDPLLDQGEIYAWRLGEAGVPVRYKPPMTPSAHAFTAMTGVAPDLADVARREIASPGRPRSDHEARLTQPPDARTKWSRRLAADYAGCVVRELATPQPGPGEVRGQVRAAAVNFPTLLMTRGEYQQ